MALWLPIRLRNIWQKTQIDIPYPSAIIKKNGRG
jgi:hypothetical protein